MSLIRFGASPEDAGRALVLAAGLLQGPSTDASPDRPLRALYGVCGVGLFAEQGRAWPTIFVDAPDMQGTLVAIGASDFPRVNEIIRLVFPQGPSWLTDNLKVVHVAPCAKHADTGDKIIAGTGGRLGALVRWGTSLGYLTAGHVGQRVGNTVVDAAGGSIGSVVYANDPQPNQHATADIDIALVKCDPTVLAGNIGSIRMVGTAKSNDRVIVQYVPPITTIVAYCKWFVATTSGVTFADVYLSSNGITGNGDSGAPVVLAGNSQSVIGHVVAGGRNTSCFQDVKPQMARVRSDPQFAALTI